MKAIKIVVIILAALCAVAAALLLWRPRPGRGQAVSIGIIGGADDPTAVYTGSGALHARLLPWLAALRHVLRAVAGALGNPFAKTKHVRKLP